MVLPVLLLGALVVGIFIFKDNIAAFISGSILNPVGEAVAGVGEAASITVSQANKDVFNAGVESRKRIDEVVLNINRETKVREIEKAAIEQGFSSIEEFEMFTDSCSLVVGSSRTMCDVGLIGSPESISPKGGQTNIGTQTTSTGGKTVLATTPVIKSTSPVPKIQPPVSTDFTESGQAAARGARGG